MRHAIDPSARQRSPTHGRWLTLAALVAMPFAAAPVAATRPSIELANYADVIDRRAHVGAARYVATNAFFDLGSWCGYALPADGGSGFVGPYAPADGITNSTHRVAAVVLRDPVTGVEVADDPTVGHALPGRLEQTRSGSDYRIEETLVFSDAATALVRIRVNVGRTLLVAVGNEAGQASGGFDVAVHGEDAAPGQLRFRMHADTQVPTAGLRVAPGAPVTLYATATCEFDADTDSTTPRAAAAPAPDAAETVFTRNDSRWRDYVDHALAAIDPRLPADASRRLAVKAVETLIGNWRAPRGDLRHDGLLPSASDPEYDGFWAWDSWKHAIALARFAPELAKSQVRAMFDYQCADGMVPDVVYRDRSQNNERDTKPPLAAIAVLRIWRATGDRAFVREMFPRLLAYHRWWYRDRDHQHRGIAEFGSTDGTPIAAAWESGMDNALRFTGATLLPNAPGAWSFSIESADLNSYLVVEKDALAVLGEAIGERATARVLRREAASLRRMISGHFFDSAAGAFGDRDLTTGRFVGHRGPESWLPLWAGAATRTQARAMSRLLLDASVFDTYVPFPSLEVRDPGFAPRTGYWRGPVWIDQAYLAVAGLARYGFHDAAQTARERLLTRPRGLESGLPMFETYHPRSGEGLNSPNFSWSAAYFLLLLEPL